MTELFYHDYKIEGGISFSYVLHRNNQLSQSKTVSSHSGKSFSVQPHWADCGKSLGASHETGDEGNPKKQRFSCHVTQLLGGRITQ